MNDLKVRKPKAEGEALDQLKGLRAEIDVIDNHLIQTLAERMAVAEQIGDVKKEQNVSVLQDARWGEILDKVVNVGAEAGLSEDFIKIVYKAIHQESINKQEKIVTSK